MSASAEDAYVAMLDGDNDDVDALWAAEHILRKGGHHERA